MHLGPDWNSDINNRHLVERFALASPSEVLHVVLPEPVSILSIRKVVKHHGWINLWFSICSGEVDGKQECRSWPVSVGVRISCKQHKCPNIITGRALSKTFGSLKGALTPIKVAIPGFSDSKPHD